MAKFNSKRFEELWKIEWDLKKEIQELKDEISNQQQQLGRSESSVRGSSSQYQTDQFEIYKKKEEAAIELKHEKLRNLLTHQKEIEDEIAPLYIAHQKANAERIEQERIEAPLRIARERAAEKAKHIEIMRSRGLNEFGRPLRSTPRISNRGPLINLRKPKEEVNLLNFGPTKAGLQARANQLSGLFNKNNPKHGITSLQANSVKAAGPLKSANNLMGGKRTRKVQRKKSTRKGTRK